MRVVLLLLCCLTTCVVAQKKTLYKWDRKVRTYEKKLIRVVESTEVTSGGNQRTMLMSSTDLDLRGTPIYRSQSLHDFNTGQLALKPLGSKNCFLGKVWTSFDETLRELQKRNTLGFPVSDRRRRMTVVDWKEMGSSGNTLIDEFCSGLSFIEVKDAKGPQNELSPRYPPLFSIYGPVDIMYESNRKAPTRFSFNGCFSFSP